MSKAVVAAMESDFFEAAFLAGPWPALRDEHLQRFSWADTAEEREAVVRSLLETVGVSHLVLVGPAHGSSPEPR